ncbi:MAG: ATP-binding cassette domain-containing protein [Ignavibacteriales bacterium]|nr:ATP-binding cassette domain-containing protein [Ignavibacteriales bacterium]
MSSENKVLLNVKNLSKDFLGLGGNKNRILEDVSFNLHEKEFKTILAPQGAGKTILLRIIGGFESATIGSISFEQSKTTKPKAIFIPSNPSALPWLSVETNINFTLEFDSKDELTKKKKIKEVIELVGLAGYDNHIPDNRSVGFRFRISLARALAVDPQIILIDEPFNNLDITTKKEIYSLMRKIHSELNISFLFATSNISEAIFLSDSIVILEKNPAKILKELNVNLPLDRGMEIFTDERFLKSKNEIEQLFKSDQKQLFHTLVI